VARVFDYSGWRPNPTDIKAAGVIGVSRYLATSAQSWKVIGKFEYDRTLAAGLAILLNWEETAGSWRGGYQVGRAHGAEARRQARALGHPDERPIVESVDQSVSPAELGVALDYQRGFNDGGGVGPQGVYGTCFVIDACFSQGLVRVGWQAAARAWYGNRFDCPNAGLIQRITKSYPQFPPSAYDENDTTQQDWGQHPRPGDGPLTGEDAALLASVFWS
jgi:hypothetical protein